MIRQKGCTRKWRRREIIRFLDSIMHFLGGNSQPQQQHLLHNLFWIREALQASFRGWSANDCLLSQARIATLETDLLCWNRARRFPIEWWPCVTSASDTENKGSERIYRFVHVHSSTPLLILDSFTLVSFTPVILIYSIHAEESRRAEDLLPFSDSIRGTFCI